MTSCLFPEFNILDSANLSLATGFPVSPPLPRPARRVRSEQLQEGSVSRCTPLIKEGPPSPAKVLWFLHLLTCSEYAVFRLFPRREGGRFPSAAP